jgi:hypothetical protein
MQTTRDTQEQSLPPANRQCIHQHIASVPKHLNPEVTLHGSKQEAWQIGQTLQSKLLLLRG